MRIRPPQHNRSDDDKKAEGGKHHKKSDNEKKFKLPEKKEGIAGQMASQQQAQNVASGEKAASASSQGIQASEQVSNITQAILKMVDSMQIGKMGAQDLLTATLKNDESIHSSLRNALIKLEQSQEGLKVYIEPTAGNQDVAEALIASHNDQVLKLQETLAAKNINLQHFQVGDHVAELAHVHIPSPSELFSGQQMDHGRGGDKGKGEDHGRVERKEDV